RRRKNLADPIGPNPNGGASGTIGDALASPTCHIGPVDLVRLQFDLDLGLEPPAPREPSARSPIEGTEAAASQGGLSGPVLPRGRRFADELTCDDLVEPALVGETQQILHGREMAGTSTARHR